MDPPATDPASETVEAERLIESARSETDPTRRQMTLLEAEILLEDQQVKLLKRLERATSAMERDTRWLIALTIALLVEALGEAIVLALIR